MTGSSLEPGEYGVTGSPVGMMVTRSAESWQFFAFIFGAILATAFAFIDDVPAVRWRIGLKVAASVLIAYFTLLSPTGRNFLVGVLNRFKTVERR
jgi:hypothetical protein